MKFIHNRRLVLSRMIGAMSISVLPIANKSAASQTKSSELPKCPTYSKRHGDWRVMTSASSTSTIWINSMKGRFAAWRGTTVPSASARLQFSVDITNDSTKIVARIPPVFSVGSTKYEFIEVKEGKTRVGGLRSGGRNLRPQMNWVLFTGKSVVATGLLNWTGGFRGVQVGKNTVRINLGSHKLDRILRGVRDNKKPIYFALKDRDGRLLQEGRHLVGVSAGTSGFVEAVQAGKIHQTKVKSGISNGQCKLTPASGGVGCFLTTACCEFLGRPDDCWELRTLRSFRDNVLSKTSRGRDYIMEYYEVAPRILEALPESRFVRAGIMAKIYMATVLPCAVLVAGGRYRLAFRVYCNSVDSLSLRYLR